MQSVTNNSIPVVAPINKKRKADNISTAVENNTKKHCLPKTENVTPDKPPLGYA